MSFLIIKLLTLFICIVSVYSFGAKITLNSSTTSSITNYNTDLAACACNIIPGICDNFCCCDTTDCSTETLNTWNNQQYCRTQAVSNLQAFCADNSGLGFSSFEDLGCVYFSNRGNIGSFFDLPQAASLVTVNSFAQKSEVTKDRQSLIVNPTSITSSSYLTINGVKNFFFQSLAGKCVKSPVKISSGLFSVCEINVNSNNCKPQTFYGGLPGISIVEVSGTNGTNGTNCSYIPKSIVVDVILSSSGNAYTVQSVRINTTASTYQNISLNSKAVIKTTVNLNLGTQNQLSGNPGYQNQLSGNPGYLNGRPLMADNSTRFSLPSFISLDNSCASNGSNPSANFSLKFNQPLTYTCTLSAVTNDTKSLNLAIDHLFTKNYTLLKYGSVPAGIAVAGEILNINGIQTSHQNFSEKSIIVVNILYSQSGWTEDPQNYILAATVTAKKATNFQTKSLVINWIDVPLSSISSPPENYFYQYFQILWTPLKSGFSSVTQTISGSVSRILAEANIQGYLFFISSLVIFLLI